MQESSHENFNVAARQYENKEKDRVEIFWKDTERAISDFFAEYKSRKSMESIEERIGEAISREKSFAEGLIHAVEKAKGENPGAHLLVLLDIDDTIAVRKSDNADKLIGNFVRPVVRPLLTYIKKEFPDISYGFLTTRKAEVVSKQLEDACYLGEIRELIDEKMIYSTWEYKEDLNKQAYEIAQTGTEEEFNKIAKRVRRFNDPFGQSSDQETEIKDYLRAHPEIVPEKIEDQLITLNAAEFQKLEVIRNIKEKNPDTIILAVDDFHYTALMKNGFYVDRESLFSL